MREERKEAVMALTMQDAERLTLPIRGAGAILADPAIQQRVAFDPALVHDYAALYKEGHDLGRLVVFDTEEGWLLADGFHRLVAAGLAGLNELPCAVYRGTRRDAVLCATSSNLHGKPLTNADKRKRVTTLLADPEWAQWSDNQIARHCGVTQPFVGMVRKSLITVRSEDTTSPSLHSEIRDNGIDASLITVISENDTSPSKRTYVDRYGQERTMDVSRIGHHASPPSAPEPLVLEPEADEMTASTLTDRDRACFGPRDEKEPGSISWCWQTIDLLKNRWTRKDLTDQQWAEILAELRHHEVWKTVPPEEPYGSLEALLGAELGLDHQRLHEEALLPSSVGDTLHEAMGKLEMLAAFYRATPPLFELHQQGYLALKEACLRFAALVAPAALPTPAPDAPESPPFDPAKCVLGKLCPQGHEHGTTGQSLLRVKGRYCVQCNIEAQRQQRQKKKQAVEA
jgi:hypothetical protein